MTLACASSSNPIIIVGLLPQRITRGSGDRGEDHQRQPGSEAWGEQAVGAELLAAQVDEHKYRDDCQAEAEGDERIAVGACHDERETEEEERGVEDRLQETSVDREANVGAQVEA